MNRKVLFLAGFVCGLAAGRISPLRAAPLGGSHVVSSRPCKIAIEAPETGARVGAAASSEGFADIPSDGYLWIFSHLYDFDGYWPQGNGAARIVNQHWGVRVFYGKPVDVGSRFEVIAMVVNRHQDEELRQWVAAAPAAGYPPTALPDPFEGCPVARVVVQKIR